MSARIQETGMQMHAGAGESSERLGHETGDAAVSRRNAAHGTFEQHGILDCPQRVRPVLERDLELARRVFGHQGANGQSLRARRGIKVVEQR
jgi:hypothetical protein